MSFVITQPETLTTASGDLEAIGAAVSAQTVAAAAPTTGVVPAAGDPVSALIAAQFSAHGAMFQAVSEQAAAVQQMFAETLRTGAGSYATAEAANAVAAS